MRLKERLRLFRLIPASLLGIALLLPACGPSRTPDLYLLESGVAPLEAPRMPATSLVLDQVIVPDYLDRSGIVLLSKDGTMLDVPQFNLWAEPLSKGSARVLRQILARPVLARGVSVVPGQDSRVSSSYALSVEIVRLEATAAGDVTLELRWTLLGDAHTVCGRGSFASVEKINPMPAFGSKEMFRAIVNAESRLFQTCGNRMAGEVAGLLGPKKR